MFKFVGRLAFISFVITNSTVPMQLFGMEKGKEKEVQPSEAGPSSCCVTPKPQAAQKDPQILTTTIVLKHKLSIQKGLAVLDVEPFHSSWSLSSTGTKSPCPTPSLATIFTQLINEEQEGGSIKVNLFQFSLYEEAYALCKARARGVNVKMILNSNGATKRSIAQLLLHRCGITINYYSPDVTLTSSGGSYDHAKFAVFTRNKGRTFLSKISGFKDNSILAQASQLSWIGSYNHTDNSNSNCFETVAVNSDSEAVEKCSKNLDALIKAANKTEDMVMKLESSDSDIESNGAPSDNVIHLLHSKVICPEDQDTFKDERFLNENEILNCQDFAPDKDSRLNRLIPENIKLPGPCYLLNRDSNFYILMRKDTKDGPRFVWLLLSSLTENQEWIPVQPSEARINPESKKIESNVEKYTIYTLKIPGIGSRIRINNPEELFFKALRQEDVWYSIKELLDLEGNETLELTGPYDSNKKKMTSSNLKPAVSDSFPKGSHQPSYKKTTLKDLDIKKQQITDDKNWSIANFCHDFEV